MRRLGKWLVAFVTIFALASPAAFAQGGRGGSRGGAGARGGGARTGGARAGGVRAGGGLRSGTRSFGSRGYSGASRSFGSRGYSAGSRSYTGRSSGYSPRAGSSLSRGYSRSTRGSLRIPSRSYSARSPSSSRSRATYSPRSSSRYRTGTVSPSSRTARGSTTRGRSSYNYTRRTPSASRSTPSRQGAVGRSTPSAVGRTGFTRRSPGATASRTGTSRTGTSRTGIGRRGIDRTAAARTSYARYGYQSGTRQRTSYGSYGRYHSYYRHHGYSLSWCFGWGRYYGCRYYYPYYSYCYRRHYAFFYCWPVTFCYAPFGFYYGYPREIYVTRTVYVNEDYGEEYETVDAEEGEAQPAEGEEAKEVEPEPAADSPTTEKFLREASEAFHKADYEAAAKKFRLAAVSAPESPAPLFALGQALIALGQDEYASRVIRRAVLLSKELLREPGDIVGVYKDQAEFDRVLTALAGRAAVAGSDAHFLLGVQRYFSGDPRARETFAAYNKANPDDKVGLMFATAVEERFKAADELPEIETK